MKVTLVLDPYDEKHRSGLGRAAFKLTHAIVAAAPDTHFIIALKRTLAERPSFPGNNWEICFASGGLFWLDEIARLTRDSNVHVFFTPVLPLWTHPKRSVVVVHDFAYRFFPNEGLGGFIRDTALAFLQRRALRAATDVVAVSDATRTEAALFSGRSTEDIAVIYNGVNDLCISAASQTIAKDSYFLLGGGIKERKNTLFAIEGYAVFVRTGGDEDLWVLGEPAGSYGAQVRARVKELGLASRVRFLGYPSDTELAGLYRSTRAFIFPSVIEGFGMMPFEAISCGAPVVYADTPVLREVIGQGGLPVDPYDSETLGTALVALANDDTLRADLLSRGRACAARYSWKKAGQEFACLLGVR
ncbi:glycosyltransferase family 1 protein [Candidatus Kaiserbacteria bacterium]|nr:glycosyltransferase family 1 protein [Candidatus Kaiserbacteria bacterium]